MYTSYMGCPYVYEATMCENDPEEDNYEEYIEDSETRKAIHVGDTPFGTESGLVFARMEGDFMKRWGERRGGKGWCGGCE